MGGVLCAFVAVFGLAASHEDLGVVRVASAGMEPTIRAGQRVMVEPRSYSARALHVNDIVALHPPAGAIQRLCGPSVQGRSGHRSGSQGLCSRAIAGGLAMIMVLRVEGLAGDRIAIRRGLVVRDGWVEHDRFVRACTAGLGCDLRTVSVPRGEVFVVGDNRLQGNDSRLWGPVPERLIEGRAARCLVLSAFCHTLHK